MVQVPTSKVSAQTIVAIPNTIAGYVGSLRRVSDPSPKIDPCEIPILTNGRRSQKIYIYIYTCMYIYIYTKNVKTMYICICMYIYVCIYIYMYVMCVRYTYARSWTYVCVHTYDI